MEETSKGGVEKKKRVRRESNIDSNAKDDTNPDKADLRLSQALLKKEKTRALQLNSTAIELNGAVHRHRLYMKHFKGVSPSLLRYYLNKKRTTSVKRKSVNINSTRFIDIISSLIVYFSRRKDSMRYMRQSS